MLKQIIVLSILTLSIGANAAMVTTTLRGEISGVSGTGDASNLGQIVSVAVTYDDAGTEAQFWYDGTNGVAEAGGGDDTLHQTFTASNGGFYSDATFGFSGLPVPGAPLLDVFSYNGNYMFRQSSGASIQGRVQADAFQMQLLYNDGNGSGIMQFTNFTSAGNETYTALVSSVPVPAAVWLFGSALMGLGVVKRRRAA